MNRFWKTVSFSPVMLLGAAVGLMGCIDTLDTDSVSDQLSRIEGYVESGTALGKTSESFSLEGAVVTLGEVRPDGSVRDVSTTEATTDAEGKFLLETNGEGAGDWVVIVEKASMRLQAMVSSKLEKGKTARAQPLNEESSIEAELLVEARAEKGASDEELAYADIAAMVSARVAAKVRIDAQARGALKERIRAFIHARRQALAEGGVDAEAIREAARRRAQAQTALELALHAGQGDAEKRRRADSVRAEAEVEAHVKAGISLDKASAAIERAYQAALDQGEEMDSELREELSKEAGRQRVVLTVALVAKALGDSTGTQSGALGEARARWESEIRTAATAAELDSAFVRFQGRLQTHMEARIEQRIGEAANQGSSDSLEAEGMSEEEARAMAHLRMMAGSGEGNASGSSGSQVSGDTETSGGDQAQAGSNLP